MINHKKKLKILHILPAMNIGGVETAVIKSYNLLQNQIEYRISTVLFKGELDCNQISIFKLFINLFNFKKRWLPDVVVTSLWISHPFGYIFKLFGIKWVAFFHNSSFTHNSDKIVLPISTRLASICICDSEATKKFMFKIYRRKYEIVPYIFNDDIIKTVNKKIDFIWIGRNHLQKRLDLVEKFVSLLTSKIPHARVHLIVSGDEYKPFNSLLNLNELNVKIFNNVPNLEVINQLNESKFYLLFSDYEGMSMTTIEAIQNGCVPVVRPVGEISNYLNADSAFLINDITDHGLNNIISQIEKHFFNIELHLKMNNIGLKNISKFGTYCDSFLKVILK